MNISKKIILVFSMVILPGLLLSGCNKSHMESEKPYGENYVREAPPEQGEKMTQEERFKESEVEKPYGENYVREAPPEKGEKVTHEEHLKESQVEEPYKTEKKYEVTEKSSEKPVQEEAYTKQHKKVHKEQKQQ